MERRTHLQWSSELRSFLELVALAGVSIAQPTFDILAKNSTVFITRQTSAVQLVAFTLLVILVPPALAWLVELVVGLIAPRARRYVHAGFCGLAVAIVAIEVAKKQTPFTSSRVIGVGILAGLAAGVLVLRFETIRMWLRYLAFAVVAFAVLFLFFSPVTSVVFRQGPSAADGVEIEKPSRVVMIVMDEFPLESLLDGTGHVDAKLFPHFAELAGTSTWYRNATTVAPFTQIAVPAIVTGDKPESSLPAVAASYPDSLFTLLGGTYEMNVHETLTRICPSAICGDAQSASSGGFRGLFGDAWESWQEFASPTRNREAIDLDVEQSLEFHDALETGEKFVRSLRRTSRPSLDYLHVLLPHQPWHYLPTGQDSERTEHVGNSYWHWNTEWSASFARQRHLLQVQAADRFLGQVIAKLERLGAWDETLFVLTADHGVAFVPEESMRGVSEATYPEILWTPFFVKAPGQVDGVVDDRPVESIDVFPTIADILGADLERETDGRSALGRPRPQGQVPIFGWEASTIRTAAGDEYGFVDGAAGFASTLAGHATDEPPAADLRLYRTGDYPDLLTAPVAPLVSGRGDVTASIRDADEFDHVVPGAAKAPWTSIHGRLGQPGSGQALAIAVNGVVAGLTESVGVPFQATSDFWANLPPQMFREGRNSVRVYLIEGPPATPKLVPVTMRS